MSVISDSEILAAIGPPMIARYRIIRGVRPATGRIVCPQPKDWEQQISSQLFFEIFELKKSRIWKVSLIIRGSYDDQIVNRLRERESHFLKDVFRWELPKPVKGITVAVYKKILTDCGCESRAAIKLGFEEVDRVCAYKTPVGNTTKEWQSVIDQVKLGWSAE
jgi:hypothetical protein